MSMREEYEREIGIRLNDEEWHRLIEKTLQDLKRKGVIRSRVRPDGQVEWVLINKQKGNDLAP